MSPRVYSGEILFSHPRTHCWEAENCQRSSAPPVPNLARMTRALVLPNGRSKGWAVWQHNILFRRIFMLCHHCMCGLLWWLVTFHTLYVINHGLLPSDTCWLPSQDSIRVTHNRIHFTTRMMSSFGENEKTLGPSWEWKLGPSEY